MDRNPVRSVPVKDRGGGRHITVELPFKICKEVYDALVSWLGKGMVPTLRCRATVVDGWHPPADSVDGVGVLRGHYGCHA